MIELMRSSFYRLRGVIRKSLWRTEKEEKSSQRGDERSQGSCSQDVNKNIAYVIASPAGGGATSKLAVSCEL